MSNVFILGGPGVGKTTLINQINNKDIKCFEENFNEKAAQLYHSDKQYSFLTHSEFISNSIINMLHNMKYSKSYNTLIFDKHPIDALLYAKISLKNNIITKEEYENLLMLFTSNIKTEDTELILLRKDIEIIKENILKRNRIYEINDIKNICKFNIEYNDELQVLAKELNLKLTVLDCNNDNDLDLLQLYFTRKKPIFAFVGNSAVGKTSIINELRKIYYFHKPIHYTTRKKRDNEKEDEFVYTNLEYMQKCNNLNEFACFTEIYDNQYGIKFQDIDFSLKNGYLTIINVDEESVNMLKKYYNVQVILIYINKQEQLKRLEDRSNKSNERLKDRVFKYDYRYKGYLSNVKQIEEQIKKIKYNTKYIYLKE